MACGDPNATDSRGFGLAEYIKNAGGKYSLNLYY